MRKKWLFVLTAVVLLIAAFSLGVAAQPVTVTLNGESLNFDVQPLLENGRLLVPLRAIAEALGAGVEWADVPPAVMITRGEDRMELRPGLKRALKNNREFNLEAAPQLVNGRVLVPVRFVSEALGAQAEWQAYTRTVVITGPAADGGTGKKAPESLPVVGSLANLKKLLEEAQPFNVYGGLRGPSDMRMMQEGTSAMKEAMPAPTTAPGDFSQTNIQVQGVDEADIIKTDGIYIYQVNRGRIVIARAYPPGQMEICSLVKFDDESFTPQEIYVDEKYLVVIGTSHKEIPGSKDPVNYSEKRLMIYPPPFYFHNTVKTIIFDIRDRNNVKKLREVELEGYYASSRKIGASLYLVANKNIGYYHIMEEGTENPTPSYRDTAVKEEFTNIDYASIRYFPGFTRPNYMIVAGLNLDRHDEEVEVRTFLGASENIYASLHNLYATVTGYDTGPGIPAYEPSTYIYKFALDNGRINYTAKGTVPGTVLNQFSMDEFGEHFRLATTSGNPWSSAEDTFRNNIFILDEELKLKGKIEDIAPGEKIYSVRFMGKKGYLVTFRTVDPLFVLDLENPENPRILGALKIPGYSDYLHPYDENHIIGFGKDTMEILQKDRMGNVINTAVIDLGMKIALFDVSDVHNPVEKFTEMIGGRGTNSELLHNHKALLFSREKNLLAFPITVMESKSAAGTVPDYGEFTFQGAYVYNLDLTGGFKLKGKITHLSGEDYLKAGCHWYDSSKNVERIIYMGDVLYTLSQGMFKANDLGDLKESNSLLIPGN
ncbi:MAG: hypothetical protein C4554_08000 [Dethiobacter sp.]|nr:MAG: hypothetical protein C4554_08000 [Dethiobacter sp.]